VTSPAQRAAAPPGLGQSLISIRPSAGRGRLRQAHVRMPPVSWASTVPVRR